MILIFFIYLYESFTEIYLKVTKALKYSDVSYLQIL